MYETRHMKKKNNCLPEICIYFAFIKFSHILLNYHYCYSYKYKYYETKYKYKYLIMRKQVTRVKVALLYHPVYHLYVNHLSFFCSSAFIYFVFCSYIMSVSRYKKSLNEIYSLKLYPQCPVGNNTDALVCIIIISVNIY